MTPLCPFLAADCLAPFTPRSQQSISDEDILALVNEEVHAPPAIIELLDLQVR